MPAAALTFLQIVSAVGSALTAVKLHKTGLARRYRLFFAYFVFRTPYVAVFLLLNPASDFYLYLYLATQPVTWFFYTGIVLELFSLILQRHRGLYSMGRRLMWISLAVSIAISALAMLPKITPAIPQNSKYRLMSLVIAGERGLDFTLVISLLLMLALLSMYAVPLSRNVMVHAGIYTAYFLAGSLGMILRTTFGLKNVVELDTALMSVSCGCVLAWLFLLSPQGEETKVRQPWLGSDQEARILQHLDALNAALLKSAKK
jgi:hypothetical protein